MIKLLDKAWFELVCRLLLGGIFVYASIDKISHPAEFAKVVYNYQILPAMASNLTAMVLPWLELFAGLALLVGIWRAESSLTISLLLVVFIVALSVNLVRGVDIDCGCLSVGGGGRSISLVTIVEDVLLLAAGMVVFRRAVVEEQG
jgi:uncharacterized membrane protein YphA (DoxX/SURF4 family)